MTFPLSDGPCDNSLSSSSGKVSSRRVTLIENCQSFGLNLINMALLYSSPLLSCVYINFIVIHFALIVMYVMYDGGITNSHVERSEKGMKVIKCYHQQARQSSAQPKGPL